MTDSTHTLTSPAGAIEVALAVREGRAPARHWKSGDAGCLYYTVRHVDLDRVDITPSLLGLDFGGAPFLGASMEVVDVARRSDDATWVPVCGERAEIRDRYNEMTVTLREAIPPRRTLQVVFRAYEEGVAFRYVLPEQDALGEFVITGERTEFRFPEGSYAYAEAWMEGPYTRVRPGDVHRPNERPLLVELPSGACACVHEAAVDDYARMMLAPAGADGVRASLSGDVRGTTPFATPWRVIIMGERPGDLIENNDIIRNLNEPCALADTSWVRPGTLLREYTLSTPGAKRAIDWAAPFGISYLLFDAGWYGHEYHEASDATSVTIDTHKVKDPNHPGLDLPEVVAYARERGMGVWLYVNHRHLERQRDDVLDAAASWGIAGIKYGFVNVGPQSWTRWLHDTVKACAKRRLMVDIHDEYRTTGYDRTYPNLLTVEGIRGNEHCPDARHNCTLPFARFTAGHGDYTPAFFSKRIQNTYAHQLALPVIFFSPLQCLFWVGDKPFEHEARPELEFWRGIPTTWDETRVLDGRIGEFVVTARRSGRTWYVAAITNEEPRHVRIDLSFLKPGVTYGAGTYTDDAATDDPRGAVACNRHEVDASAGIDAELSASGGCAIKLSPTEGTP